MSSPILFRFVALFISLLTLASAQSVWTVSRTQVADVAGAYSIAFGNGRFVLTTSGNGPSFPSVLWSTDGESWNLVRQSNVILPQQATVRFIDGYFYLAGSSVIVRSSDGVVWEDVFVSSPLSSHRGMASDGRGLLIGSANSNDKALLFTADRLSWRLTAPLPESQLGRVSIGDLAYVAGRYFVTYFVMLADSSLRTFAAATSDGTRWDTVPELASAFYLTNGNGRLVAYSGGAVLISTDGRTFSRVSYSGSIGSGRMGFAGGRFFFLGSLQSSLNGETWSSLASAPVLNGQMLDIAYGNGRYVAVGYDLVPGVPGASPVEQLVRLSASAPPLISAPPLDVTVVEGSALSLSVSLANADSGTMFQWRRDGVPIPAATTANYAVARATRADAGRYTVEARNALGSVQSDPATVTVVPFADAGRIINLSVLTSLDEPDAILTAGFVVGGHGTAGLKPLLVRAGGPSLIRFGVERPNADPKLELFNATGKLAENDQWSGADTLVATGGAVGAFPFLSADSKDAALIAAVAPGDTTARISSANTTGAVIAEVYDATPASQLTPQSPRLVNVSVRKRLAPGTQISAGFVIGGRTPKRVLIRAVGPSLAPFGVTDAMADPRLEVFRVNAVAPLASNQDWGGGTALASAMSAVGAFALSGTSKDAALLLVLEPGNYVAQAAADSGGGTVLVEVYDVP
jgi:hypothetical protein